jgi:ATP-binding protein involved in chromosome partitioning
MAQIPLFPPLRGGGDTGVPIVVSDPDAPASTALVAAAEAVVKATKSKVGKPLQLMAR